MSMRCALIRDGQLSLADDTLSLADLQRLVGGLIEAAFTVASCDRDGYAITGYVNEEGMLNGMEINVLGPHQPLFGPLVVVGLSPNGETCELTAREFGQLSLSHHDNMLQIFQTPEGDFLVTNAPTLHIAESNHA